MFWKGGHLSPVVINGRWSHVEVRLQEVNSVQLVPVLNSVHVLFGSPFTSFCHNMLD